MNCLDKYRDVEIKLSVADGQELIIILTCILFLLQADTPPASRDLAQLGKHLSRGTYRGETLKVACSDVCVHTPRSRYLILSEGTVKAEPTPGGWTYGVTPRSDYMHCVSSECPSATPPNRRAWNGRRIEVV
ncbi:hypothetical protein EVAR_86832_1 [Eumeta japonica]|uniref:Uncharacterized protein n=1 Tax=Eumeta variegata TaxID=151549 RepID=A0A4C1VU43_EUMVA|nr:hypothetical protein EVAR_86832_1 [Eumeta japonica]